MSREEKLAQALQVLRTKCKNGYILDFSHSRERHQRMMGDGIVMKAPPKASNVRPIRKR